jgi:hypothetical protein
MTMLMMCSLIDLGNIDRSKRDELKPIKFSTLLVSLVHSMGNDDISKIGIENESPENE